MRQLVERRARRPEAVAEAAATRGRRASLLGPTGRLMVIAADHPARASLGAGGRPIAMADRWQLLDRLVTALDRPGVDGVLATADVVEDLLLLGVLDGKVVIGSMNRGGLARSAFELDDRFTGYTAESLAAYGFDGGKMLIRIDPSDPGTVRTLEASATAISALASRALMAMVEPFWASRVGADRVRNDLTPDAVVRSVAVAAGLGATSAYTWLKLPVVDDMERVLAASTLPALLLGGDAGESEEEVEDMYARWAAALKLPTARGIVAGRALLYPPDDDVAAAVDRAVGLLAGTAKGGGRR